MFFPKRNLLLGMHHCSKDISEIVAKVENHDFEPKFDAENRTEGNITFCYVRPGLFSNITFCSVSQFNDFGPKAI